MGSCGGGSDQSTTQFRRVGTTNSGRTRDVPAWLVSAIRNNIGSSSISDGLGSNEDAFLSKLLTTDYTNPPGRGNLDTLMTVSPTSYTGLNSLTSIANTDPFSSVYAEQLASFYKNLFDEAAAAGPSG